MPLVNNILNGLRNLMPAPATTTPVADDEGEPVDQPNTPTPVKWLGDDDVRKFNAVIEKSIEQAGRDAKTAKYYKNLFKNGEFKDSEGASANYTFSDVSLVMSTLYNQNPGISVQPHNEGDLARFSSLVGPPGSGAIFPDLTSAQKSYAKTLEKILKHTWTESRSSYPMQSALFEGIVTGMGVIKVGWDDNGYDRIDSLHRHEIFIDPNARYDVNQAQYILQVCTMELEEAKQFFAKIGCPTADQIRANYELKEEESLGGEQAKKNEPDAGHKGYYRFYEIWHKKPTGDRKVYYRNFDNEEWFFVRDWPYRLDPDGFPYAILTFNTQFEQVQDAFGDLHATNGLRRTAERIFEFFRLHVMKSIATKYLFDSNRIDPAQKQDLLNTEDLKFIGIPGLSSDMTKAPLVQRVDFTSDSKTYLELFNEMKHTKDEISGIADLVRGDAPENQTATGAQLEDKWGRQRINRKQKVLDEFISEICRKRAMVCLQLMPPEKVEAIAGQLSALVWKTYSGDVDDLKCEYSVDILSGSTAEDYQSKRMSDLQMNLKLAQGLNTQQPFPVIDSVKMFMDILELQNLPHPEKYKIGELMPMTAGLPPTPPAAMPGQVPQPPPGMLLPPAVPGPGGPNSHPNGPPGPGQPPQNQGPMGNNNGHPPMPTLAGDKLPTNGPPHPIFPHAPVNPVSLRQGLGR